MAVLPRGQKNELKEDFASGYYESRKCANTDGDAVFRTLAFVAVGSGYKLSSFRLNHHMIKSNSHPR